MSREGGPQLILCFYAKFGIFEGMGEKNALIAENGLNGTRIYLIAVPIVESR